MSVSLPKAAAEARAPNICSKDISQLEKVPSVQFTKISRWKIKMCSCYNLLLQFPLFDANNTLIRRNTLLLSYKVCIM